MLRSYFMSYGFAYLLVTFPSTFCYSVANRSQSRLIICPTTIHVGQFQEMLSHFSLSYLILDFWPSPPKLSLPPFYHLPNSSLPAFKLLFILALLKLLLSQEVSFKRLYTLCNSFPETFLDLNNLILFWFLF